MKRYITWDEVFERLNHIENSIGSGNLVYGIPKGGMIAAGFLRHNSPTYDASYARVFLDDLIDSGATKEKYAKMYPGKPFVGLFDKQAEGITDWLIFPWEKDHPMGEESVEQNIVRILQYLGEDVKREGLLDTPKRVVKSWEEIYGGYKIKPASLMTVFENKGMDEIVLLKDIEFHSMCLPGNQFVNVVGKVKRARNIIEGDLLWTLVNGVPTQTTVEKITTHTAPQICTVVLENGVKIRVTQDHPLKTPSGWEEAGKLMAGDVVEWINTKTLCKKQYPIHLNYDFGYVLGAVASDGGISGRIGNNTIRLCVSDKEFAKKFQKAVLGAFEFDVTVNRVKHYGQWKEGIYYLVNICSSQIAKRLKKILGLDMWQIGPKTKTFHLPKIVLSDENIFAGFLDGYIDGDGSKTTYANTIITSNLEFAKELADVLDTKVGDYSNNKIYRVYVSNHWREVGWMGKHGFQKQEVSLDLGESQFIPVKDIYMEEKPTKVYSFKCKEYPSFLVQGILTHNCEHHMLPFYGKAHVAYIPDKHVIGVSKLARLVDAFSRRLQIQENIVDQVTEALMTHLKPKGAACIIEAQHLCMKCRGVGKQNAVMTTSSMKGVFLDNLNARQELMQLLRK